MLAIVMSTLLFAIMIGIGILLMCIIAKSYKKPNCKPLEIKDFIWTLIFSILFCLIAQWMKNTIAFYEFWYYYLSVFISVVMFADSKRFKSLM